ncbi:MAG: hypothetical protein HYS17_00105 [Micavibrio aeruginosavorus]|uniref:Helicase superfamily 3 single-stranded DNA/RNA virus domain-containing protein n=1 Tax=Micavibrio aeruginosavorus TaxID=349221 RepID=A0A7T5UHQ7_9BACT|nr:MAG: hypothetical protein HYS17_00105 [Micavibrio aeruginosavorus]
MGGKNQIQDIRPGSTFSNYAPQNENQKTAASNLRALAQSFVDNKALFAGGAAALSPSFGHVAKPSPFPDGMIIFLHGTSGTGKSHLIEAVINQLKDDAPEILPSIYFYRGKLHYPVLDGSDNMHLDYERKPIIVVDDLFADKQSLQQADSSDYKTLSTFLTMVYEKKCLAVMSSNFSLADELLPFLQRHDRIGRITSRVQELVGGRGFSVDTSGPDYRVKLAEDMQRSQKRNQMNPFASLKSP